MDGNILSNFHKSKPSHFGNPEKRRQAQSNRLRTERRERRTQIFNIGRNINALQESPLEDDAGSPESLKPADPVLDRKLALLKFKKQKEEIKKQLKTKQKPPFIVGIPHHGSSPIFSSTSDPCHQHRKDYGKVKDTPKKNQNFVQNKVVSVKKLTSPHTPTVMKRSAKKDTVKFNFEKAGMINPKVAVHAVKRNSPASSVSSGEPLAAPLADENNECDPTRTPDVTLTAEECKENLPMSNVDTRTRRRLSERKRATTPQVSVNSSGSSTSENSNEQKSESSLIFQNEAPVVSEQTSDEVKSQTDSVPGTNHLSESDCEPSNGPKFQRERLERETKRLLELADKWETLALQAILPKDVTDEIDSVVGNTRLLTRDKFKQFRGLIDEYENPSGDQLVTCNDLDGFWEMMYLQVDQLVKKYTDLEKRKENNFSPVKLVTKKKKGQSTKSKSNVKTASSSIREMIKAQRAKKDLKTDLENSDEVKTPVSEKKTVAFFTMSGRRLSRSNSPFAYAAMRLSGVGRLSTGSPSVVMEPYNPNTTPRSILKSRTKSELHLSARKVVLFKEMSAEETVQGGEEVLDVEKDKPDNTLDQLENRSPEQKLTGGEEVLDVEKDKPDNTLVQLENRSPGQKLTGGNEIPDSENNKKSKDMLDHCDNQVSDEQKLTENGNLITPRQSKRLKESCTTPRFCIACNATHSQKSSSSKKKSARKPRNTTRTPKPENSSQNTDTESAPVSSGKKSARRTLGTTRSPLPEALSQNSDSEKQNQKELRTKEVENSKKNFVLRPSKLVVTDITNLAPIDSKKPRGRKRGKGSGTEEHSPLPKIKKEMKDDNEENSLRRSSRQSSARKVTFDCQVEEKSHFKLPATPFKK